MRTRRLILPFFSIPVTEAWPISPVRATCVEAQGRGNANDVIVLSRSIIGQSPVGSTIQLRPMAYQGDKQSESSPAPTIGVGAMSCNGPTVRPPH